MTAEKLQEETGYEGPDMLKLYEEPIKQKEKVKR